MHKIIGQIHKLLVKNQETIAVAESCTGGLLSSWLTKLSGSSKYFILGLVTYSNQAKNDILDIPVKLITKKGAVSEIIAKKMAQNVRQIAKTNLGIGITGIAGPTGTTATKPVGTVYIALTTKNKTICHKLCFRGNRSQIRQQAALKSLQFLKELLITNS